MWELKVNAAAPAALRRKERRPARSMMARSRIGIMWPGLTANHGNASREMAAERKESGAIWLENAALCEAAFGNATEARRTASNGLKLMPTSLGVNLKAAPAG